MKKKLSVVLIALLSLAACSKVNRSAQESDGVVKGESAAQSQAYSQGVGQRTNFAGSDVGSDLANANCMSAPEHQIYHFAFDSTQIAAQDRPCIAAQIHYLKQDYRRHVWLYGNTDERGSREYNVGLGERRGNTISDFLKLKGVRPSQITVISYGQEKPVDVGHDENAYRKNRRVELYYKGPSYVG